MLHLIAALVLAAPVDVPSTPPPNSANMLKLAGWVMWGLSAVAVVGIAKSGALLGAAGSGRGGSGAGEHGVGFVIACVGAAIVFAAGTLAVAMS
jgi:hypothetical protein